MRKILASILLLSTVALAQKNSSRYEVEILMNPNAGGKDTREVNAVLMFEESGLKVISRRKKEVFSEFNYSEIKYVEHSYSKTPFYTSLTMGILTGLPVAFGQKDKHWLTLLGEKEFAVLKIESDNFRLIRMELMVRDFDVITVNENSR